MCDLQARFYGRYTLLSAVERRAGGQGVVQFARILGDQSQVRLPTVHVLVTRPCRMWSIAHSPLLFTDVFVNNTAAKNAGARCSACII